MSQPPQELPASTPVHSSSTSTARSSSKSSGDEKSRISVIEKSVTHLLVATKTLLETLTRWSKQTATESEVSDVYVRLGYEFNIACRAFNSIGVETQDLGPVPDLLRTILEETLSGEPSQAHLDKYLPRIRDIIVNLLQGLKKKQSRLRQRHAREGSVAAGPQDPRQGTATDGNTATGQDGPARQSSRTAPQRQESTDIPDFQNGNAPPPRTSSTSTTDRTAQNRYGSDRSIPVQAPEEPSYTFGTSAFSSSPPQDAPLANPPSLPTPPYPQEDTMPSNYTNEPQAIAPVSDGMLSPPQARHGDALAQLQRGGELERRASRRFSAYHIQKHLGPSSNGIPMIPPAQNSPIPNRGRDVRESMNAVRVRGTQAQARADSRKGINDSPNRRNAVREAPVQEAVAVSTSGPLFEMPAEPPTAESPYAVTPEDKLRQPYSDLGDNKPQAAELGSQVTDSSARDTVTSANDDAKLEHSKTVNVPVRRSSRKQTDPGGTTQPERPTSAKELTLFLQYKTRIKKFVLPDGYEELSIARLQLAFIEKFAWNTNGNGLDLPEIYIQDPVSGVRYELEDLADVKTNSVLVLNVDSVEEVKKHVDDSVGGLKALLQDVRTAVTEQHGAFQRFSDKQLEANKDISRLANAPPQIPQPALSNGSVTPSSRALTPKHLNEVQTLRRDLAVMRQSYTTWLSDMQNAIGAVRDKADNIKSLASATGPTFPSAADTDSTTTGGRAYVNNGRKTLNSTSETLMTRVEELQDTVEDLRKDVVTRGVRPLPRQLETVSREISTSATELKKLQEFIKREKPTWTKIWKDELQVVCDDQNLLTYQEELCADLEADLEAAAQTFGLVEEATKQQNLVNATAPTSGGGGGQGSVSSGGRSSSRTLNPAADPHKAKDGVLGEVRALQPNHESRLEAIERAEKLRQKELESRLRDHGPDGGGGNEFKKELSGFVDEGRLKKSGGFEEAERMRKVKDEMARREVWERLNGGRSGTPPASSAATTQDAKEAENAVSGAAMPQPLDVVGEPKDLYASEGSRRESFADAYEVPPEVPPKG